MSDRRKINPLKWLLQRHDLEELTNIICSLGIPFTLSRSASVEIVCVLKPIAGFKCHGTGKTPRHAVANALAVYLTSEERDYQQVIREAKELGTEKKDDNKRTRRFNRRHPEGRGESNDRSYIVRMLRKAQEQYNTKLIPQEEFISGLMEEMSDIRIRAAIESLKSLGVIIEENGCLKEREEM
jgi:hypothetical protein